MLKGNADMTQERQRVAKRESEGGRKVGKQSTLRKDEQREGDRRRKGERYRG